MQTATEKNTVARTISVDCGGVGAPIVMPTRRFEVWDIAELYTGPTGDGQYLPNVRDFIIDYSKNCFWKCIDVDYTRYAYTLEEFNPVAIYNDTAEIGGCGPNTSETFRIMIDPSKHPMTLRVDSRLNFTGSDNDSIRVFRGANITSSGEVISAYFKAGILQGDTIPLQLAAIEGVDNKTIKSPVPGHCKRNVDNGELVTIVCYSDTDEVTAIARAYALHSNITLASEAPARQVMDVRLISPFINPGDDRELRIPLHIPLDDIPLEYEVTYTDGKRKSAIDGTRCKLDGLRNSGSHDTFFISSTAGQKLDLTLFYRLAKNETYVGDNINGGVYYKDYKAITDVTPGAYSVKIYVIPEWMDSARGYRLRYYLYNLERGNIFEATAHVRSSLNSAAFDPLLFGVKQRISINCDLSKVSPVYVPHIHAQTFHITLLRPGSETGDGYLLEYSQGKPNLGEGLRANFDYDNVSYWALDLSCGCTDKAEWLDRVYRRCYPLYNPRSEDEAPTPTHFNVVIGSNEYVRTVDQWLETFNIDFSVANGNAVQIRWFKRTPTSELQLGVSSMLAWQVA